MLTGDIRNQIDKIWDAFWAGGIANPLEVIEQITYLLFIRRLDDLHTLEENKANRLRKPIERRVFPEGKDSRGRPYADFRWSRFKHFEAKEMFTVISEHVFPFLRELGGDKSTYSQHMEGARFTVPTPALLARVVDMLDAVPMEDRDTKGDLYEYMLAKIATAGQNGQFRTPRHIIRLMVEMVAPQPTDIICDPACGTAGFLMTAGEYLREHNPEILRDAKLKEHFHHHLFHGFDFDNTMLRIGSMNMLLHGVENPDIRYRDSLTPRPGGVSSPSAAAPPPSPLPPKPTPGGPDPVWFYDVAAAGMSLDDNRTDLPPPEKLGPVPKTALTADDHAKNNLPDVLARWAALRSQESEVRSQEENRPRTAQSFRIPQSAFKITTSRSTATSKSSTPKSRTARRV